MSLRQRRIGMLILAVFIMAFPLALTQAQDSTALTVAGSGLAAPVLEQLSTESSVQLDVTISGSAAGLSSFCAGTTDIALATRPMTVDEEAACNTTGVEFNEFILGHNILGIVANEADTLPQCLTSTELNALFVPSATASSWAIVAGDAYSLPVSIALPSEDTVAYSLLDTLVDGVGLRDSDVTVLGSRDAILEAVAATPGTIGVITLGGELPAGIRAFEIDSGISGCIAPTADNVERRLYPAANRLFAYISSENLETARPLFAELTAEALSGVSVADFVAPSERALTLDQTILAEGTTGRSFSREVTAFAIPESLVGQIAIAGSVDASSYMEAVTGAFVTANPAVTLTYTPDGVSAGIQQFCNGEIDAVTVSAPLTDEQLAACAQNNVTPEVFSFGSHAVVVVVNSGLEAATCLTLEEVAKVWGATADGVVENWSTVREGLPDLPITIFTPVGGSLYRDLLVLNAGVGVAPRADAAEENADPAYRVAATANVEGATTFMTWAEYNDLPATEQERVSLVSVDGGAGCIAPSVEAFSSDTYPLARPVILLVNRLSIGRVDVQSFLWFASSDANYNLLTNADLVGLTFDSLADRREQLETLFVEAAAEAAQSVLNELEATPEATGEATAESEMSPEPTTDPVTEATAESTSEPTAEATVEATTEATAEAGS